MSTIFITSAWATTLETVLVLVSILVVENADSNSVIPELANNEQMRE